ncbi:MAG: ComEC/Rec2 family competence protein [Parcubacteria group bacterium]
MNPPGQPLLYLLVGFCLGTTLVVSFSPLVAFGLIGVVTTLVIGPRMLSGGTKKSAKKTWSSFLLCGVAFAVIRVWVGGMPLGAAGVTETRLIEGIKQWAVTRIDAAIPYPANAVAAGVLFGYRDDLPQRLVADMRASGLSHLLAVSGYNVTIVAALVAGIVGRLVGKRSRTLLVLIAVVLYVLLCGAGPPVVRAGVMGGIGSLVLLSSRPTQARRALLLATTLLLFWDPYLVRFDVGFKLSVAATAGLVTLGPLLQRLSKRLPNPLGTRDAALTSLAASLATLPVVACTFGTIPLYGIAANILAAPLVPVSMLTGCVALLGGVNPLGKIAGLACAITVELLSRVAHIAANLPGAQQALTLPGSLALVGLSSGFILAGLFIRRARLRRRAKAPLLS